MHAIHTGLNEHMFDLVSRVEIEIRICGSVFFAKNGSSSPGEPSLYVNGRPHHAHRFPMWFYHEWRPWECFYFRIPTDCRI